MPREYRHIGQYAKEIYELREQGLNLNEIREAKKKEKVTVELQLHSDQGFQYTSQRIQLKTKLTPLEKRCQYVA